MYGFKYTIFFAMYLKHIFGQLCALKYHALQVYCNAQMIS